MIAVDANVLVYAHRRDTTFHDRATTLINELAVGQRTWMIPWPCLHEFLAIVTHPRIYKPPSTIEEAVKQVDGWLESPSLKLESESEQHWPSLRAMILRSSVVGPLVHDARIAAICQVNQVEALWTADRDFSRFPGVPTVNPLVTA